MMRKSLLKVLGILSLSVLTLSACSTNAQAINNVRSYDSSYDEMLRQAEEQKNVWDSSLADDSRFQLNISPNAEEKALARYCAKTVINNLKRSEIFVHFLLSELKNNDLPIELAAIPLIESGINPQVRANNGAHGAWQYIRATGRSVGLNRSGNYDELYDFVKSTKASVKYLKRMYKDLGNWELVVAAYNQGEYGVRKALEAARARGIDVKSAADVRLSRGARNYVKRFRAYADILKNPEQYHVNLPEIKNRPAFKRVEVADHVNSLSKVAHISGAHIETLKRLNAGYLSDKIDNHHGLLIPVEHAAKLEQAIGTDGQNASNYKYDTEGNNRGY